MVELIKVLQASKDVQAFIVVIVIVIVAGVCVVAHQFRRHE
jgi:hypothetical protein